jgi:hypothetical protein
MGLVRREFVERGQIDVEAEESLQRVSDLAFNRRRIERGTAANVDLKV